MPSVTETISDDQRVRADQDRHASDERLIAGDPSLATAENLANATGSTTLARDAARARTQRQLQSQAAANMAAFRGEGTSEVTGEVSLSQSTIDALVGGTARALDRGTAASGRTPTEAARRR